MDPKNFNFFSKDILKRGKDYYDQGNVSITHNEKDYVEAIVRGTEIYNVRIHFSKDIMTKSYCTCPYTYGKCKHVAAVLYALEDDSIEKTPYEIFIQELNTKFLLTYKKDDIDAAIRATSSYFILNYTKLNRSEINKALFEYIKIYDKIKDPVSVKHYCESFISMTKEIVLSNEIKLGITNLIIYNNNKLRNFSDLLVSLLKDSYFHEFTEKSLIAYLSEYGSYIPFDIISLLSRTDLDLSENFYETFLFLKPITFTKTDDIIIHCIECDYEKVIKKVSLTSRENLTLPTLRQCLNYLNKKGLPEAKSLNDYIYKRNATFKGFLEYISTMSPEEIKEKMNYIMTIATAYKFDSSIAIYYSLPMKKTYLQKISFDDIYLLKDKLIEKYKDEFTPILIKRVSDALEKKKTDVSLIKGVQDLYYFNMMEYTRIVNSSQFNSKIKESSLMYAAYLKMLYETDELKNHGFYVYGRI